MENIYAQLNRNVVQFWTHYNDSGGLLPQLTVHSSDGALSYIESNAKPLFCNSRSKSIHVDDIKKYHFLGKKYICIQRKGKISVSSSKRLWIILIIVLSIEKIYKC